MRILALVDRWSRGGVPTVIGNHKNMVTEAGGSYQVYSYYTPDLDAPEMPSWASHGSARFRGDPATIRKLYALLKTYQPDVIHDHFGGFWSAFYLLRPKWARRAILHYHNEYIPVEETPDQNRSGRDGIFFKYLMPRYSKILTVSEHNRHRIIKHAGVDTDKVQTLPNSIDPAVYQRSTCEESYIRKRFSIPEEAFIVGTHGRLVYEKGIDTTIDVLADLIRKESSDRPVWGMISGSGDYRYEARLKEQVTDLGIQHRVIFTGYRNDIPDILKSMNVFVMPSRQEPFGLVILEAMAMSVPVVAVRPEQGGGPLEIIEHGRNGLLIDERDFEVIAESCRNLLHDPDRRLQITRQAHQDLSRYHPENIGAELLKVYQGYC